MIEHYQKNNHVDDWFKQLTLEEKIRFLFSKNKITRNI